MDLGFEGTDLLLALAAGASVVAWLLGAGAVYLARRPPEPSVGPRTLDLGTEPPAVANFLVNRFTVTDAAVPATLIDLAARNVVDIEQRGPDVFFVRLRSSVDESLTVYEEYVLDHLRKHASDGVVPAEALTTGPQEESKRWGRVFRNQVDADAQRRGLSRDAFDGTVFTILTGAAVGPALLIWAAWEFEPSVGAFFVALVLLGWIRARHPQRETPAGLEAASRWLGVRAELAENAEFTQHSPLTVELWDRLLAYGAALGVAAGASRPLPMGVESDTHAWSAHGGRWRPVRIAYPRVWPPGWGAHPLAAFAVGLAAAVGSGFVLYTVGPTLLDAGGFASVVLLGMCAAVVVGVAVVLMAGADWKTAVEVTGPILRLRTFGDDEKRRYYVAVDDGSSPVIRAFRVKERHYSGLQQGEVITVRTTKNLAHVQWIIARADDPTFAG
ncbi:MAG TPA: hypothetical protein VFO56_10285 [Gaiellaceae bacterium]|nr:hypothetical protein [Gaiellaceae bacterium]